MLEEISSRTIGKRLAPALGSLLTRSEPA